MPSVEELNKAIMTIREECASHSYCMSCPLYDSDSLGCMLHDDDIDPDAWKPIEGQ